MNDHAEPAGHVDHVDHVDHVGHVGHVDEGDDASSDAEAPGLAEIEGADAPAPSDALGTTGPRPPGADLDAIAADLDGVEAALRRLDDGSYWTDEATGDQIPDEVLVADPVTRRAG